MANVYNLDSTDGTLTITLKPGTLNGPGGGQRDTDMRLYGMGALMWGEGVDQNILRLTENFACEEKDSVPGVPKDENDTFDNPAGGVFPFRLGRGINNPIEGQQWYNKSDELMYYYTGSVWKKSSAVIVNTVRPDTAEQGDFWYDLNVTADCGEPTIKFYDPGHPSADGFGWVRIGFDRLSRCGGEMSGTLDMSPDGGTSRNRIVNLDDPIDPYDAVHQQYVDDEISAITGAGGTLSLHIADQNLHLTTQQNNFLDALTCIGTAADAVELGSDLCKLKGWSSNTSETVWTAVDRRLRKDTGGVMQNFITLHAPPSLPNHAATKDYVDTRVGGGLSGGAQRYVRFFNTIMGGSPLDGDVAVTGGIVYIYSNGWKQVFPAQYS